MVIFFRDKDRNVAHSCAGNEGICMTELPIKENTKCGQTHGVLDLERAAERVRKRQPSALCMKR